MSSIIIGIDLGTTYSGAAVYSNDWLRMIPDIKGNVIIPSMVAFHNNGTVVGEDVPFQMANNVENSIYDAKRFIGRSFNEPWIRSGLLVKRWPFKIVNHEEKVNFEMTKNGQKQRYLPEQISAFILRKLKQTCEQNLGEEIKDAVISVPAYFNDNQRNATKSAAEIAGLNVLRIINEPTAAALAYGFGRNKFEKDKTILVYDLGGGTFDVSIVNMSSNDFTVRATAGDSNLGGQDFTNRIRNYCIEDINKKHGVEIQNNVVALSRLTQACENSKRRLSVNNFKEDEIRIMSINSHKENTRIDYSTLITRKQFEAMNEDSFNYTMDLVEKCLNDAKLKANDIDEVLLVGGSTRIPKVQQIVENYFSSQKVNRTLNADEAVALGAAIQGSIMRGDSGPKLNNRVLFDVTPLSLGTDVRNDEMNIIIKKNTLIPVKQTKRYVTTIDNQTAVNCGIYQGERANVNDNFFLGKFKLIGLREAPAGEAKVDVTFDLNTDGVLNVTAQEIHKDGTLESITIEKSVGRLGKAQIEEMIETARRLEATDAKFRRRSMKKNELDRYCHDVEQYLSLGSTKNKVVMTVYKDCQKKYEDVLNTLSSKENRELEDYEDWLDDLKETCESSIGKLFFDDNGRHIGEHVPVVNSDIPITKKLSSKYSPD